MVKEKNLLAIESSTSEASVALFYNNHWYIERSLEIRQHAKVMLGLIQTLLSQANTSIEALDGIVYGSGPGSFTGLRVACAVAKGLAYAHDLPLYAVSSLDAILFDADTQDLPVLAMIDARMKEVYWKYQEKSEKQNCEPQVSSPAAINIPNIKACVLAGTGFEPYVDLLPDDVQNAIVLQQNISPSAQTMIKLVHTGCIQPLAVQDAVPMYVRNQVVQENKK